MAELAKGAAGPLNYTQEAHHRVFVGLGWDPNTKIGLGDKLGEMMGGKKTHHDLDLQCFVYDAGRTCLARIGAKSEHSLDAIGQIYHSGDNAEGLGDGDDEQISAELKNLPEHIHTIVFVATIRSGHTFKDLHAPEIRLADGYSDHDFLKCALDRPEGEKASAFVFASIFRGPDGAWQMKNISEYANAPDSGNWDEALKAYF